MKTVHLKNIKEQDSKYSVFLGNGTAFHFSSRQKAVNFLNQTNKFLTTCLYEARQLFAQVSFKYNENWGYFEHNKKTMGSKQRETDRCCNELLYATEKLFDLIVQRGSFINGNYFVFIHFNHIIENQKAIIKHLSALSDKKSITADLYRYDILFKQLQTLNFELNNYCQINAKYLFKVPVHISIKNEFIPENKIHLT